MFGCEQVPVDFPAAKTDFPAASSLPVFGLQQGALDSDDVISAQNHPRAGFLGKPARLVSLSGRRSSLNTYISSPAVVGRGGCIR